MNTMIKSFVFTAGLMMATQVFAADTYKIDTAHSTVGFSVVHMMVSHTTGVFNSYEGTIAYNPQDLNNSKVDVTVSTASIDTRNTQRDGHLKSPDFFDVEKFPSITFVSKKITATAIIGDLTIKGVTKEVSIPATISGPVNAMGKDMIGINANFTINRQDYGLNWNKALDKGGVAVSNEVNIAISIEADLETSAPAMAK